MYLTTGGNLLHVCGFYAVKGNKVIGFLTIFLTLELNPEQINIKHTLDYKDHAF